MPKNALIPVALSVLPSVCLLLAIHSAGSASERIQLIGAIPLAGLLGWVLAAGALHLQFRRVQTRLVGTVHRLNS